MKIIEKIKSIPPFFVISILILAASWSLFHPELFFVHDYIHAARVIEMFRGLTEGQFPVRWSDNFGYGYGMPLFEFYAPLPFFIGALLLFLDVSMTFIVKTLFFIPSVLAAVGAYKLGKVIFSDKASAIVVSIAYTLASYRAVNLFVRGAVSESWAMGFLPFVLYFGILMVQDKNKYWKHLTLSLTALLLSHNITAMIFIPLSGIMLLIFQLYKHHKEIKHALFKRNFLLITGSYFFSVLLSAFYWLPAILEKDKTILSDAILDGYFDYHLHFLYIRQFFDPVFKYGGSVWGPEDGLSFFLGWGQLIGVGLLLVFLLRYVWMHREKMTTILQNKKLVYVALFGLAMLLTLSLSLLKALPLWEAIPLFGFIQFPWRFLSIAVLFISVLTGAAVSFSPGRLVKLLVFTSLFLTILLSSYSYFQPAEYLEDSDVLYYTDEGRIRESMSSILPDYIPAEFNQDLPVTHEPYLPSQAYEVEILVNRAHEKAMDVMVDSQTVFTFAIANFPGWSVYVDGNKKEKLITHDGLVSVEVPEGEHTVSAKLEPTTVRLIADTISAISLFGLLLLLIYEHQKVRDEI